VNKANDIGTESLIKKKKRGINRDVVIFVFFLIGSFVFWYLNSLGKESEAVFEFPVSFINLPKERMIVDDKPISLNIYFKGSGSSLLKLKVLGKRIPVIIDLSTTNYKRVPEKMTLNYFITTSGLKKNLAGQIRSECEVTSILPDTLFFTLKKADANTIHLIPDDKTIRN